MKSLVVTGTDTDVGKTFVTAMLLQSLRANGINAAGYKPVCSGLQTDSSGRKSWHDIEVLFNATDRVFSKTQIGPQCFDAPLAPPVAAKLENRTVDPELLIAGAREFESLCDWLLIEGAGGWLSPITDHWTLRELCPLWNAPVLVVARLGLGTLNHTLLTIEAIEHSHCQIAGVVLNQTQVGKDDLSVETNLLELKKRTRHPVWGVVPFENRTDCLPASLRPQALTAIQIVDCFESLP